MSPGLVGMGFGLINNALHDKEKVMKRNIASSLLLVLMLAAGSGGCTEPSTEADQAGDPHGEIRSSGRPLGVTDEQRFTARHAFSGLSRHELTEEFDPERLYQVFSDFVLTHFSPGNPVHPEFEENERLAFPDEAKWLHASLNSAALGFSTSVPARTYVEFGEDPDSLESVTDETDRYYVRHTHLLKGLESGQTYHYRLVARNANGEVLRSAVGSFTTADESDVELLSADNADTPLVLDRPDTTYVLTEDVSAGGTAIRIEAPNVTLDLNGHTIAYADSPVDSIRQDRAVRAATGIWANLSGEGNIRVINGRLREGQGGNQADPRHGGLHALYLSGAMDVELAGLQLSWHGAQVYAAVIRNPRGQVHIHHNDFADKGYEILDRHGAGGGRPLHISSPRTDNEHRINNNLVRRTRQNGFGGARFIVDNEIHVDSWATNSFAIQPFSSEEDGGGRVSGNRIFLAGYNPIGVVWAHRDLEVSDNRIQMEGLSTGHRRFREDWGEQDTLNAFRITNYGEGGQVRENLHFRNNQVVGRARNGAVLRGTMFYSDATITDTRFENNRVHLESLDPTTVEVSPIVAQGLRRTREQHEPVFYTANHLSSNVALIRFGDEYGLGDRHIIRDAILEQTGDHSDFHTIVFDGGWDSGGHRLIDPEFRGDASYDDVWWRRTSTESHFHLYWTLTIEGDAGASVKVHDGSGEQVHKGVLDSDGEMAIPLRAATVRPEEWSPGEERRGVRNRHATQVVRHGPHQVTLGDEIMEVDLYGPEKVRVSEDGR